MLVSDYQLARARLGNASIYNSGFGAFGTASTYEQKDCPPKGSWEDYCDCVFAPGTAERVKCRRDDKKWYEKSLLPPWTEQGKADRGLPGGVAWNPFTPKQIVDAAKSFVAPSSPSAGAPPAGVSPTKPSVSGSQPYTTGSASSFLTNLTSSAGGGAGLAMIAGVGVLGVLAIVLLKKK